jgi:hypothetical protein
MVNGNPLWYGMGRDDPESVRSRFPDPCASIGVYIAAPSRSRSFSPHLYIPRAVIYTLFDRVQLNIESLLSGGPLQDPVR